MEADALWSALSLTGGLAHLSGLQGPRGHAESYPGIGLSRMGQCAIEQLPSPATWRILEEC